MQKNYPLLKGAYLEIIFEDNGSGMSKQTLEHIFEPFFTTKDVGQGTGLGLSAVYGTIKDHHGTITVESEVNVGSKFHIFLPLLDVEEDKDSSGDHIAIHQGSGVILLIDDDELTRNTTQELLKMLGYDVITAENGEKGLEEFEKNHAQIRLVMLDIVMPILSGHEVLKKIRSMDKQAAIIICSGYVQRKSLFQLLEEDPHLAFLQKPFRLKQLIDTIRSILEPSEG
jgi:CheY-like chemotaxis protein